MTMEKLVFTHCIKNDEQCNELGKLLTGGGYAFLQAVSFSFANVTN